jgi:general secretion pathway protein H
MRPSPPLAGETDSTMVNSSRIRRASGIWWARSLSLVVCAGASSGGLGAQDGAGTQSAVSPLGEIPVRTGAPPYETVVAVEAPLVRYLLEELITQRLENAQLSSDLAAADAQRAQIEKAAREKETALAAWIAGLHDELAQREAQLAYVTAARASGARLVEEARAAEASARARRQLAAMKTELEEQDVQMAIVQSAANDSAQRLGAAEAELKRREAENERLTAELGALRMTAKSATVLAHPSAAPIDNQLDTLPEGAEQRAELLFATSVGGAPPMPYPKPRLRAGEVEALALASETPDDGAAAPGEGHVVIEDAVWTEAGLRDVAVRDWEPPSDTIAAPESLHVPDAMSTAALAPISRMLEASEGGPTGLDEAAARLADGLRATREEAILQQQERVFAVDVNKRAFARSGAEPVPFDPALHISLLTAKSELIGESTGGIRFFPDGSSTGGRIELGLLDDRVAVNVRWSSGAVTLER